MSSNEEHKPKDGVDDTHEVSPADSASSKRSGGGALIFLFFIIGLTLSMVVGWAVFPEVLYEKKDQPFDFNHKMHLEQVDNGCESCHFFRKDGTFAGVPRLAQCTGCHSELLGESKDEKVFVEQYVDQGREVPWHVYARQPACVFFPHAAHIYGAKLECKTCHGDIGTSESLKTYEVNRISGYSRDIWGRNISGITHHTWDRMKMDACAECHQKSANIHDSSAQTGRDACFVCHK